MRIIPWLECNGVSEKDRVIPALIPWKRITNTAIVSTIPGCTRVYTELASALNMTIIPGIKTCSVLPTMESSSGWRAISEEVTLACQSTGMKMCILENETTTKPYLEGAAVDWTSFRKAIDLLPVGIELVWYPGITFANQPRRGRSITLAAEVGLRKTVRFVDHSYGCPAWLNFKDWISSRKALQSCSKLPSLPIVWMGSTDGFQYWDPSQIKEIISALKGHSRFILYPGLRHSAEYAEVVCSSLSAS